MKIYLLIILLALSNCTNDPFFEGKKKKKGTGEKLYDVWWLYSNIDNYHLVNKCPESNAKLSPGIHTITLQEGQEYWFDITARQTRDINYTIGIFKELSQTLTFFNNDCYVNKSLSEPKKTFTATSTKMIQGYDGEFAKYQFYFPYLNDSVAGIKMSSGSGNIKLKVPDKGD